MKTQKTDLVLVHSRIDSYQTSDDISFTKLANEVEVLTTTILRVLPTPDVIDKVTAVNGYAELVISHPDLLGFRRCLANSLNRLAAVLESRGAAELAEKTRVLSNSRAATARRLS